MEVFLSGMLETSLVWQKCSVTPVLMEICQNGMYLM